MRSDLDTWDQLWAILHQDDPDNLVYVYRMDKEGRVVKPYLFRWFAISGLVERIQHNYGPGDYKLLIRRGRMMIFSGEICIG